jgi:hypothetical protein
MHRSLAFVRLLTCAAAVCTAIVPGTAHATLIAVYSRPGENLSPEKAAAQAVALHFNRTAATDPAFRIKISDCAVLSTEFSVLPGVSAYIWSDETITVRGFVMKGAHLTFDRTKQAEPKVVAIVALAGDPVHFHNASLDAGGLELAYTLSRPGRVSVEVRTLNGRALGRWNWEESSAGFLRKHVGLDRAPTERLFVRWSAEGAHEVRAVRIP